MFNFDIITMAATLPAIIISMAVHEYAHAQVADWLGDDTPRRMGRLTLNPFSHIDIVGMIMLFLVQFGWAKPVMVNPANFKDKKTDDMLVSIAGPLANLIVAFITLAVLTVMRTHHIAISDGLYRVLLYTIILNINFAIFNLLPIPPLDGSRLIMTLMSPAWQMRFLQWERFSFLILIIFAYSPLLGHVLIPLQHSILTLFTFLLSPLT